MGVATRRRAAPAPWRSEEQTAAALRRWEEDRAVTCAPCGATLRLDGDLLMLGERMVLQRLLAGTPLAPRTHDEPIDALWSTCGAALGLPEWRHPDGLTRGGGASCPDLAVVSDSRRSAAERFWQCGACMHVNAYPWSAACRSAVRAAGFAFLLVPLSAHARAGERVRLSSTASNALLRGVPARLAESCANHLAGADPLWETVVGVEQTATLGPRLWAAIARRHSRSRCEHVASDFVRASPAGPAVEPRSVCHIFAYQR